MAKPLSNNNADLNRALQSYTGKPEPPQPTAMDAVQERLEKVRETASGPNAALFHSLGRQGLKDLQDVVMNPFPEQHAASHSEPGTIAHPTSFEVYKDKQEIEPEPEHD